MDYKSKRWIHKREAILRRDKYQCQLSKRYGKIRQAEVVHHIFPVLCERRDRLQEYLREHGVETIIHYPIPPHQQPCYAAWNSISLPITEQIHQQELSIPLHPLLTEEEIIYIIDLLNSIGRL